MTATPIYLVGKDSVFKEGIKSLLVKADLCLAGDYSDANGLTKEDGLSKTIGVIIHVDEGADDLTKKIVELKKLCANNRVVVIGARAEMPVVMESFSAGVDGYLLKDITCDCLIGSLKLVASGEKVYPPLMMTAMASGAGIPSQPVAANSPERIPSNHSLSRQELNIVQCLANGEPNKIIAHNLGITEATVKVHVKTILRKLNVTNRTQAAIWAISQGLTQGVKHHGVPAENKPERMRA